MIIYLIRHGETAYNAEKRYQGTHDIPLSAAGRSKLRDSGERPARVYVTPLRRTRETAELLFPNAEQIIVPGLREMSFGAFEGRNYLEMEHDPDYRAWVDGLCRGKCPGGESQEEFANRTSAAFSRLVTEAAQGGEETVYIVAHGGTQMALLERHALAPQDYYHWFCGNGCGYRLSLSHWNGGRCLQVLDVLDYTREG